MTDPRPAPPLPRPAPAAEPGPLDDALYDLVEARFLRLIRDNPVLGTSLGLHQDDDLLGDGSREAVLAELADERDHLARSRRSTRPASRPRPRFERDLELHNVRRAIFDTDVLRIWERRSFALDHLGDSLFLLFARDHAPLPERLDAIAGRLEAAATYLEEAKTRATVPQVRRWQQIEIDDGRRAADLLRRDRRRRRGRPRGARAAPPRARQRIGQARGRALRRVARGHARRRDRRVGDRARAPRRAGRPARVRRPRRRRHPRARLGAARTRSTPPAPRPRARSTPTRDEADVIDRVKSDQPADVRGRARRLPRRDAPGAQPPHRARPRDRPRRRADRRHRDARVPAQRHAVRGLLRAGRVRSRTRRASTSSRRRSTATRTRCASTTAPRSATPASTRRTRAITSSSTPRAGTAR